MIGAFDSDCLAFRVIKRRPVTCWKSKYVFRQKDSTNDRHFSLDTVIYNGHLYITRQCCEGSDDVLPTAEEMTGWMLLSTYSDTLCKIFHLRDMAEVLRRLCDLFIPMPRSRDGVINLKIWHVLSWYIANVFRKLADRRSAGINGQQDQSKMKSDCLLNVKLFNCAVHAPCVLHLDVALDCSCRYSWRERSALNMFALKRRLSGLTDLLCNSLIWGLCLRQEQERADCSGRHGESIPRWNWWVAQRRCEVWPGYGYHVIVLNDLRHAAASEYSDPVYVALPIHYDDCAEAAAK